MLVHKTYRVGKWCLVRYHQGNYFIYSPVLMFTRHKFESGERFPLFNLVAWEDDQPVLTIQSPDDFQDEFDLFVDALIDGQEITTEAVH